MAPDTAAYDHLDDPQEREWLIGLDPQAVLANAHRMYDWMRDQGVGADSYLRELAFTKAADALGLDYDVLYNAWLDKTPLGAPDTAAAPNRGEQYLELARTIADQAQAIADGTVVGPVWSKVRMIRENVKTLEAWTVDDR